MRLDSNITPKRNRLATINTGELEKLSKIKNIMRKGRLRRVKGDSLEFLSGEQVRISPNTLVVDCSVNSIKFKPKTKNPGFTALALAIPHANLS